MHCATSCGLSARLTSRVKGIGLMQSEGKGPVTDGDAISATWKHERSERVSGLGSRATVESGLAGDGTEVDAEYNWRSAGLGVESAAVNVSA